MTLLFSHLQVQGPRNSGKQWIEAECLSKNSAVATSVTSGKSLKPSFVHLSIVIRILSCSRVVVQTNKKILMLMLWKL